MPTSLGLMSTKRDLVMASLALLCVSCTVGPGTRPVRSIRVRVRAPRSDDFLAKTAAFGSANGLSFRRHTFNHRASGDSITIVLRGRDAEIVVGNVAFEQGDPASGRVEYSTTVFDIFFYPRGSTSSEEIMGFSDGFLRSVGSTFELISDTKSDS
jgi:hypothetical protein